MDYWRFYDYVVINETLEQTIRLSLAITPLDAHKHQQAGTNSTDDFAFHGDVRLRDTL